MASSKSPAGDDPSKRRSLVIVDVPVEFIDREVLKNHFEQFGTVERVACSISKKYAVLHFSTPEEARNAELNGTIIRHGSPPLKIFNRATGIENVSQRALIPPQQQQQQQQQPSRVVTTRRKIVRNFGGSSGGVTVSVSNSPGMATAQSRSVVPSKAPVPVLSEAAQAQAQEQSPSDAPIASTSKFQQAPLRSSIKISRPSPYLRRKPSYGDKSGKAPAGGGVVPRNPFALPPRNMLSLDRRRKTTDVPSPAPTPTQTLASAALPVFKGEGDSINGKRKSGVSSASSATLFQSSSGARGNVDNSSEIQLDEDDDDHTTDEIPSSSKDLQVSKRQIEEEAEQKDPAVDLDESTEDAAFNDEPEPEIDNVKKDPDYNPLDEAEADTDTQDTQEVTTEEEGEIMDNEVNEEDEEEEEDDEPYESPLKRMEKAKAAASSSAAAEASSGGFSFKLTSSKPSSSDAKPSTTFKAPFSSPFGFGDTSKPFSATAFGSQFGGSKSSTSIFAGGASSSNVFGSASKDDKPPKLPMKENDPPKFFEVKKDATASSESEKPKPFTFFSSLANQKSASSSTSSSVSKPVLTSSSANLEVKPSIFSASKLSTSSTTVNRQPSPSFASAKPSSSTTSTSVFAAPKMTKKQTSIPVSQTPKDCPNPLLLSFTPDTAEAQELFSKRANTAEERYRILEARDKIIRARVPKAKVNVEFATKLVGTCPDMCPEKERYMRQFQRQLVAYEILPGGTDVAVDHQKAIKAYSRSSADQEEPLPHELRPGPTLDFTMDYLLRFIVPLGDNPDENLSDWYNFLWDRTRSIRKDITQQQIIDMTAVSLFEKCARFHIHCASRLCELDVHSFDPKLNDENLMKCIQSLEHLYEDLRRRQVNCPNEPEFRAYQIMMNLNEGDALYQAQQLPTWILNSREVQSALKLHHCIYMRNFVGFFRTVETLPYMTSCILHRYFFQVRSLALRCFIKAHCTLPKYETAMPMSTLQRMLGYGPNGALSFSYLCEAHGIHCDVEDDKVILKRKMFYLPECPSIYRENFLVDSKLRTSVAEAINGGSLPEFIAREPHSSFNDAGQLIAGDVVGSGFINESQPATSVFVPPEISSINKSQSKSGFGLFSSGSSGASSFSFGAGSFSQAKKDRVPSPAPVQKPVREIEAACKAATTKIIEESLQNDLVRMSEARLIEARVIQEKAEKRRLQEQIATRMASEFLSNILAQQTENLVRREAVKKIRQMRIVEHLSGNASSFLLEETVLTNVSIAARTELMQAREHYHRVLMILRRIFLRLRARFAVQKWMQYAQKKKFEREREEERRREQLWNFPVINSYSLSTKDVFQAFCGRTSVQPSLNKVDMLGKSPEDFFIRPKRKSDGDAPPEYGRTPNKLPRLTSGGNIRLPIMPSDKKDNERIKDLWDFPVIDSYSRTNRQVLEAFCGSSSSHAENISVSPKINKFGDSTNNRFTGFSQFNNSSFFIRKPAQPISIGRLGEEIRTKTSESTSDFLNTIQSFLSKVKEEASQSPNLEPYQQKVEEFKKNCPEVNSYIEQLETSGGSGHRDVNSSQDLNDDSDNESDWMDMDNSGSGGLSSSGLLSGLFVEEDQLLNKLKQFKKQVKEESERTSWDTETFLNKIDINIESY